MSLNILSPAYAVQVQELADQLESLVDKHNLATVLDALGQVCSEKAEHLRSNWQDDATAYCWDMAAACMLNTAQTRAVKTVS